MTCFEKQPFPSLLAALIQLSHITEAKDQKEGYMKAWVVLHYVLYKLWKNETAIAWSGTYYTDVVMFFNAQIKQFWTPGTFQYSICKERSKDKRSQDAERQEK